jgi:hypothetical protein
MSNGNKPAFPRPASEDTTQGTLPDGNTTEAAQTGMSLRAYLAGRAMQGLLAQHITQECESGARDIEPLYSFETAAQGAVMLADMLIAELSKQPVK